MLMDEPLASLDASRRHGLREEIGALVRSLNLTTIYVTHDQVEALALADRIAVLRDGALEDVGSPTQMYCNPATAFVASFLGSPPINLLSATVWVEHGQRVVIGQTPATPSTSPHPARCPSPARCLSAVRCLSAARCLLPSPMRPPRPDAPPRRPGRTLSRLRPVLTRRPRPASDPAPAHSRPPGEHRRADIVMRLDSPRGWEVGQVVSVVVDVTNMYLFNAEGERIDKVPY